MGLTYRRARSSSSAGPGCLTRCTGRLPPDARTAPAGWIVIQPSTSAPASGRNRTRSKSPSPALTCYRLKRKGSIFDGTLFKERRQPRADARWHPSLPLAAARFRSARAVDRTGRCVSPRPQAAVHTAVGGRAQQVICRVERSTSTMVRAWNRAAG
jgi:hypothetical protein